MSNILVIDDEPGSRLIVQSRLKDVGFQTGAAETGATGLNDARAGAYDIFLVASGLESGVDGLEVCRRLKAMPETQDVPVILYCNRPVSGEELTRGYEAGAEAYLSKAEMPVLDHVVRVQLRQKSRQDDLAEQNRGLEEQARRLQEEHQRSADLDTARDSGEHSLVFRELAAGRPDGIMLVDAEGHVRSADRGACELLSNRLEGKNLGSLAPATGLEAFVRDARTEAREGFRFDVTARKGIAPRSLTASVIPLVTNPGDPNSGLRLVLLLDAGKRRIAAEMLRVQEPGVPRQQLGALVEAAREVYTPDALLGPSEAMQRVRADVVAALGERGPVLLRGEAGTGRARTAATLHYSSGATGPFLRIRCDSIEETDLIRELFGCTKGATPDSLADRPGLFQQAKDGSILLESIGKAPSAVQERLLQALEKGVVKRLGSNKAERVAVRVLASTDRSLTELVAEKRFLPALADQLSRRTIELAPLRERPEDLGALTRYFLGLFGGPRGVVELPDEVLCVLERHPWRGNIDELASSVEYACGAARGQVIGVSDLPRALGDLHASLAERELIPQSRRDGAPIQGTHVVTNQTSTSPTARVLREVREWDITDEDPIDLEHYEKKALLRALAHVSGDRLAAARLLNVGKSTLYRKLKRLGIH